MVLSRRERYIALITVTVLAATGVFIVGSNLFESRQDLDRKLVEAKAELDSAEGVVNLSHRATQNLEEMARGRLLKDRSEADSQILNSVRDWAQEAGLSLSSVKPERADKEKGFDKITYRATGNGTMAQIGRFLYRIQTATVPVRVTDLTISSRKEGTDDLSLTLGISTIYQAGTQDKVPSASAGGMVPYREVVR